MASLDIFDKRLLIVSGKGGVGKSTLCSALALSASRLGKRTLIVEMDEKGELHETPDMDAMRRDIFAVSIDDSETRDTIGAVYMRYKTLLEPHGAVGWAGLLRYLETAPADNDKTAICLETAHPAKFPDEVRSITGVEPEVPPSLAGLEEKPESYDSLNVSYDDFKSYLLEKYAK